MRHSIKSVISIIILIAILTPFCTICLHASAEETQLAMYIFKSKLKITCLPSGHGTNSNYPNKLPYDVVSGVSSYNAYAPFDCKVIKIISSEGHTVAFESINKVLYPDGTIDYMTFTLSHDDDISDLKVGKEFNQGDVIYQMGNYGISSGAHIHIEIGKGSFTRSGTSNIYTWIRSKAKAIHLYEAFFLYDNTTIVSKKGVEDLFKFAYQAVNNENLIAFNSSRDTSIAGYYYLTTNYASIQKYPESVASLVRSMSHGEVVQITARGTNTYGNIWYQTTDGFIFPKTDTGVVRLTKVPYPYYFGPLNVSSFNSSLSDNDYVANCQQLLLPLCMSSRSFHILYIRL